MIHLLQVSGAHAAGKDTLMLRILKEFSALVRAIPWTTRAPRPGEKHGVTYYFLTEEDRLDLVKNNGLVNMTQIRSHFSGLRRSELLRAPQMILDITPDGARRVKKAVEEMGGQTFLVYLFAPLEERRERIRLRQPGIPDEEIDRMIIGDPVNSDPHNHLDYDLIVSNADGELDTAYTTVANALHGFFGQMA